MQTKPLHELLCKLYPRTADLRRFLSHHEGGAEIVRQVPDGGVVTDRLADDGVAELVRRGLVQNALQRAAAEFPRYRGEIEGVARECGVELAAPVVAATVGRDWRGTRARDVGEAATVEADEIGPLRWLHLSDLHVGCRGEAAWWHVLDQFWRSVDEYLEIVGTPDLVLLTGDLTFKGDLAEFERLTKFLEKLLSRLPKSAGGHPPVVVAVPGNHDLQRPTGRDALIYRVLRDFEKGRDDPDVAGLLDELWGEKPNASFLRPLFANYLAWFDGVIRPQAVRPGVTLQTSFFPGDVHARVVLPGRFPLAIVGLNSAWLQYQGGDFEGKLVLPLEQFHAALPHTTGESPTAVLDGTHRALLLMHHPRSWLSKPQRQLFDSGIYPGERFVACLHGHMHEADAINKSEAGGVARCYYQAPSLFGIEKYGCANESRAIGYTWATLHEDGELRAWPLKLKRKGDGTEVFDRDDFFHWDRTVGNVLLRPGDGRHLARPRASGSAHSGGCTLANDDDGGPTEPVSGPQIVQHKDRSPILNREQLGASARLLLQQSAPRTVISLFYKHSPAMEQGIAVLQSIPRQLRALNDEKKQPLLGLDLLDTSEMCHIILGPPGIGKTFFLWQLANSLLMQGRHIPLFIRVGELDNAAELLEAIGAAAKGLSAETVLYDSRTIVFLDGWSEFAGANRRRATERAKVLRLLAGKRLIATGRREAFVEPSFSPLELEPLAWADVLKVLRSAVPGVVPPPGLSELLRLPLPLILYLLSGRATTRGELLAELHSHLSKDIPSEFRDILAGAVADVEISTGGRKRSAFMEKLRYRAGKGDLRDYEDCLRRLGTLDIHTSVVSPIHDLYWSWLSGVGLLAEKRIRPVLRRVASRESIRLAIESGVPVDPDELRATFAVDIVFAAQLSRGVAPDQPVCDELRQRIAHEMTSVLAPRRARAALAALIAGDANTISPAIDIISEVISSKRVFNPDALEFSIEFLYDHRAIISEKFGSPATAYLLARIAERGDPRWVPWLAEMAREGKMQRYQFVGAALACSAALPEWTLEHLQEVVCEHAYDLRHCTRRGTNVALANWIAQRFGKEIVPTGSAVFYLAELLGSCGDANTRQQLLARVDSMPDQMMQTLGYTVAEFGEVWIARFQEKMFARAPSRGGYGPLTKIVSASVNQAVAKSWLVSGDKDIALIGWRVLIAKMSPNDAAAELSHHMPASFDGVDRAPAFEALQYITDAPDELGNEIWRRIEGTLTPRFSSDMMRSLAAMRITGYGPLIRRLIKAPGWLPTYQFMQLLPAFRAWERRHGIKVLLDSEKGTMPFLDWIILRRLEEDKKDSFFTAVPVENREIVAQTVLMYLSDRPAELVEILKLLDVSIPYQESLAEFVASSPATISLVPKLFAKSLGEMPEALLLRVIDMIGFAHVFLLRDLAWSSNPKHTVLHRRLIRWAVDVRQDLGIYCEAARILRVHEPIALRRLLAEELIPTTEHSLELIREVERATGNLLIDESGFWLDV